MALRPKINSSLNFVMLHQKQIFCADVYKYCRFFQYESKKYIDTKHENHSKIILFKTKIWWNWYHSWTECREKNEVNNTWTPCFDTLNNTITDKNINLGNILSFYKPVIIVRRIYELDIHFLYLSIKAPQPFNIRCSAF